jgi:hypothetical protein
MNNSNNIWIFGDSFAVGNSTDAWPNLLPVEFDVKNYASSGSSEYRIWKNYQSVKTKITSDDIVIFVHTSPYRIFLKDSADLSSRHLSSHKSCDLIMNDIFTKNESPFVELLQSVWDDNYFLDTFELIVNDLLTVPNSKHYTFFESKKIQSFYEVWQTNKGSINHMNKEGNETVARRVL